MASYPCAQTIGRGAGIGETQQAAYAPHQRRQTPLGNGRRTTWKRRACRRRTGQGAAGLLPRRPDHLYCKALRNGEGRCPEAVHPKKARPR
jgi:hypothetical protein